MVRVKDPFDAHHECLLLSFGQHDFHSSNNPIRQAHLDSMRMAGGLRQDICDNSLSHFPGALILFLNNFHVRSRFDIRSISSVHNFLLRLPGVVRHKFLDMGLA
jgi:hypothetical protein